MAFAHPENNLKELGLLPGMAVADVGAGSGAYALAAAEAVGERGKVFAIDVEQGLLEKVKNEARRRRLGNLEIIWGNAEKVGGTRLAESSIDAVILSNVLFQFEDHVGALRESSRILRSGGKLFIIDWSDSFGGAGPVPEMLFPKSKARSEALSAGFALSGEFPAGDHHYGLIFAKQ